MEIFDCDGCSPARQKEWRCPDLGAETFARTMQIGQTEDGKGGMAFEQCPGWWRRNPRQWAGVRHGADGTRSAALVTYDQRFALEHGTVDLLTMPGKAREAVVLMLALEADRDRARNERAIREAKAKK